MAKTPITKPKCLVVEDDHQWRSALVKLMLGMGCDVEVCVNAQQAISIMKDSEVRFDVVLLDWDLRSSAGTVFKSKFGADVLDALPRAKRPHMKVVIITGALDDAQFRSAVNKEIDEIHEEMDGYQTFRKIRKKHYVQELRTGLESLREHFEETSLLDRTCVKPTDGVYKGAQNPKPPFKLDNGVPQFIDAEKRIFSLPPKCHNVLRGLLLKQRPGGGHPSYVRGFLTDHEVSLLYKDGPKDPSVSAEQFARALRKFMKRYYGGQSAPRNSLVRRLRGSGYAIGDDWHETSPVIGDSERKTYPFR